MGVEEEFLLVGDDGVPAGVASLAAQAHQDSIPDEADDPRPGGGVALELKEEMLETGTHPCTTVDQLVREIREGRQRLGAAARAAGARLAALATSPIEAPSNVTGMPRYQRMAREYGTTAREQLTCGCHVHVEVDSREEGVAVLDRIGPWLPVLLAMSANSPFWHSTDSGYASYRSQVWNRWPSAGPTAPFGSLAEYDRVVTELIATGAVLDEKMIYFDARLSSHYPTVEVRVADVCLDADDAVLLALLTRALVETAAREAATGAGLGEQRVERLRAAAWRAGRSGLASVLVSPVTFRPAAAWDVVEALLAHVGPVLDEQGETDAVVTLLTALRERGTGADTQRRWAGQAPLSALVDRAVAATAA
ncbi:MAG: glutamate--cysteine ligase [Propionicimonas sp.]|nr:glutamate--cysteine ligase [Propionicimonas sp.]